jgi:hypothetical protein
VSAKNPHRTPGNFVTNYLYENADGTPAFLRERYEWVDAAGVRHKELLAWRPSGNPGVPWAWGKPPGADALLYCLPELLADLAAARPVFITEGEKNADSVSMHWNGNSTTHHQAGAGWSWAQARWFRPYADNDACSDLFILVDRDPPDNDIGATVAWRTYLLLRNAKGGNWPARRLFFFQAATPECHDVTDHIEAGYSVTALRQLSTKTVRDRAHAFDQLRTPEGFLAAHHAARRYTDEGGLWLREGQFAGKIPRRTA